MRSQVGDASYGVALDLDVGRKHLSDQRRQATELDDEDLVFGCRLGRTQQLAAGRLSDAGSTSWRKWLLTVDRKVAKCSTGSPLDLDVRAL